MGIPSECICGRVLSCSRGGFPTLRHSHIRDVTASLLSEVSTNIALEPELQPHSVEMFSGRSANKENGAPVDIAADGFWRERTFLDITHMPL